MPYMKMPAEITPPVSAIPMSAGGGAKASSRPTTANAPATTQSTNDARPGVSPSASRRW